MVYCGRPSTSCENCRAKKRRCDKAVPGCGQCRRMGQQCPGYRDPASLLFRDESSQIGDKVRARITKRDTSRARTPGRSQCAGSQVQLEQGLLNEDPLLTCHSQSIVGSNALQVNSNPLDANNENPCSLERSSSSSCPGLGSEHVGNGEEDGEDSDNQRAISSPFTLPLDMIALNYFLANYVVRQSPPSSGFLDYVPSILTLDDDNEILQGAILAVGLAGLAHSTRQADLRSRSRVMYTRTIKRMNQALSDPPTARRHSTIVTVLILSLYEFGESSLNGWDRHIQGATLLLGLRGKAQFTTPIGLQIFKDIFSHLLINCLRMGSAIPAPLRMIRAEASKAISASDPYWVASSGLVDIMDLYSQIAPGGYDFIHGREVDSSGTSTAERQLPIDELERYLSQALDIDHRLESRFSECSPEWQFTVVQLASPDPTRVMVTSTIAFMMPGLSAFGMICVPAASWPITPSAIFYYEEPSRTPIRDDILASVPQQMSYFPFPAQEQVQPVNLGQYFNQVTISGSKLSALSTTTVNGFSFEQSTYTGAGVGAYFASWMLLLAGCMHTNSEDTRQWIVTQLRRIGLQSGLAQANFFATCVESSTVRPPLST
ncbi:hypothetical protein ANOM_000718 [Aspergillus nomiae NRRL 13137]|uniref:Zn(2)-C6 fungal-type domain-containing protein n=1 Tax=Aspergillus nomiae NRRL (strain ATCC 15546 / NRRL 13137 / CBS 260.88 / M93) TaxID=1509407 RepID=A0A0L1JGU0_ASPN3|nr:uncharacterized protein ANOM_000718 [Aspergillus nomiae NRRL 13137]KNG90966.1 hypothetical protein ANOM_000718 [Aspergillus nomiae NRRL 13137]